MSGFQNTVLFGDSITQFWSNYDPDFFESNNLINKGISGQTTSQMLDRFDNDVIKLQPNPADDQLNINSNIDIKTIEILDITGKTIQTLPTINKTNFIDVKDLASGLYFLKITGVEGKAQTVKWIKK
jgi:hypothetical protein